MLHNKKIFRIHVFLFKPVETFTYFNCMQLHVLNFILALPYSLFIVRLCNLKLFIGGKIICSMVFKHVVFFCVLHLYS